MAKFCFHLVLALLSAFMTGCSEEIMGVSFLSQIPKQAERKSRMLT
ncbi:hypothetical protein J5893_05420 [bacterium]|nr:hypothetical protein [bacterium]